MLAAMGLDREMRPAQPHNEWFTGKACGSQRAHGIPIRAIVLGTETHDNKRVSNIGATMGNPMITTVLTPADGWDMITCCNSCDNAASDRRVTYPDGATFLLCSPCAAMARMVK